VYRIAGIAEDITERKDREYQLRSLAEALHRAEEHERKRLATDLHDHLAQFLALAKLKIQALNKTNSAAALSEIESTIDEALHYTRSLMNELRPALFGWSDDLVTAVKWVMEKMSRHGLSIRLDDDGGPKPLDEHVLTLAYQTVQELLWNVLKHSHTREASIAIRQDDSFVFLSINDRGVGFDPQARLQGPRNGCGFVLFSIRERVELVSGEVKIRSRPGQGTTVTVRLPKGGTSRDLHGTMNSSSSAGHRSASNIRVLLVDDHRMMREGLRAIIESQPDLHIVGEAADGEMAIALTRQASPHVVLMDVQMPVMDGIEATRRIKREFPQVCVIGLSFLEDERTAAVMRDAGAVAYFSKGKSFDTLCQTIRLVSDVVQATWH
jgi:CheY-like chemotaxis protein/two-component sensor histidine kinase